MPPQFKFTKAQIAAAAFRIVCKGGWQALTTRSLAEQLGSSARPIYSFYSAMGELEKDVAQMGVELLYNYMIRKRTGDPWQDHGLGYVMFARMKNASSGA